MAFHKFLKAASVLPALLVMPAMADNNVAAGTLIGAAYPTSGQTNEATASNGGAVTVAHNVDGVRVADGVKFENNNNIGGGAGGAMKLLSGVQIGNNVEFNNNRADQGSAWGGGALYIRAAQNDEKSSTFDTVIGDGVKFTGNKASLYGGAIALESGNVAVGTANSDDSTGFVANSAANGGAIFMWYDDEHKDVHSSLTLNNTEFEKNTAFSIDGNADTGAGGALAVADAGDVVVINNSDFGGVDDKGNSLGNTAENLGGAIYNEGKITITGDSDFEYNHADAEGGAIFTRGEMDIIGTKDERIEFENNTATFGGAISNRGTLNIEYAKFNNNDAKVGGAITDGTKSTGIMDIKFSTFSQNHAAADGGALGVYKEAKVYDTIFASNTASKTAGTVTRAEGEHDGGGAIFLGQVGKLSIDKATFTSNESGSRGGAISARHFKKDNGMLAISNSSFNANVAADLGGAIANIYDGNVDLNSVTFNSNRAGISGGAIYNGVAKNYGVTGGVMSTNHGTLTFDGKNSFIGNSAEEMGGAIYNDQGGVITFKGINGFSGNQAAGLANDIHNLGTIVIAADGKTTIDGGITGAGTLTVAEGATLNIGTATVAQDAFTLDGTLGATIIDAKNYGNIAATTLTFGENAAIKLSASTVGTYNLFGEGATIADTVSVDAGALYNVERDGAAFVLTTKSVTDVMAESGVSEMVAATLTSMAQNATGDVALVSVRAQEDLAAGNADAVERELSKASPIERPVAQALATATQTQVMSLVASRVSAPTMSAPRTVGRSGGDVKSAEYGVWAQGLINRAKMNGEFDGDTAGVAVGVDTLINGEWTLGAGYSFSSTDLDTNNRGNTDITSNTIFAYAQYKPSAWYINAAANYTMSEYEDKYAVYGVAFNDKHDVDAYGAQIMTGYDFAGGLTPEMGARYLHVSQDAYDNGLNGHVGDADSDILTGVAGVKYSFEIESDTIWRVRPEMRAAATYDFVSDDSVTSVTMPGAPAYVVDADRLSKFGGEFGLGLTAQYNNFSLSVMYDLDLHQDYTSQTGMLKMKYTF